VAGIRLGQLGKKALVVERDKAGGVCLNVGCIPSKALINAAKLYEKIAHGADLGILADNLRVDMAKLQSWKDGVVGKLSAGVRQLLKANGCDWRDGSARLLAPGRVEIQGIGPDAGTTVLVEAAHIVIATGARPVQIPGFAFDGNRVLDSTGALAFTEVPRRLVVIGAGYIGMEIGTLYAKLGSRVVFVEALPTILSGSEPDCVQVVARRAKQLGMEIIVNAKASGWSEKGDRAAVTVATPASGSSTPTRSWSPWAANQTATGWAWRRPVCGWNAASSRWTTSCAPMCPASTPSVTLWGSPSSPTRPRGRPKLWPR
jgi:dihydrolipoamide dehydrogenase